MGEYLKGICEWVKSEFNANLDPSLFSFEIPPGVDVQNLEE